MSIGQSRNTIVANVVQQGAAVLLLFALPNLLSVEGYAEVVFIGVLLSFARFADFGLSAVYGREMPRHHTLNEATEQNRWNPTMFWFAVLGGGIAGAVAAVVMYVRFGKGIDAVLVGLLPPLTAISATYVSMASVRGDFLAFRNTQIAISLSRLIAIPLVVFLGFFGWLSAQVAAMGFVALNLGSVWIPTPIEIDWDLIRTFLPAAVQLALINLLWGQLLDSARLMASVHYSAQGIATYGLLMSGYQSIYTLVISGYLPVTVKALGILGRSDREAIDYIFGVISKSLPFVFGLAVVASELSPWVLSVAFPKYQIDPLMPRVVLYGLTVLPFVATLGNLLIGKRKNGVYILILMVSLAMTIGLEALLRPQVGIKAAAIAQAAGAVALALLLLVATRYLYIAKLPEVGRIMRPSVVRCLGLWAAYLAVKSVVGFL